ncbi:caspase-1 [Alligator mississippiensis]|uniref:Caspase-1 n=1 Tax=Alligator mississippiensis TaxID=8496 RepID=A0A151NTC3_ALLMI|nr:caspase-1 [Alligator mississippiensis]KYO40132.1 caspase-1 [Alligator mississippiensis]
MADKKLKEVRTMFVERVSDGVIAPVLDDLQDKRVLNQDEAENVRAERRRAEQARYLIDVVMRKGLKASTIFIQCLHDRDPLLATELGLDASSGAPATVPLMTPSPTAQTSAAQAQPAQCEEWIQKCPLAELQRIKKSEGNEIYDIFDPKTRTRLALIICNIEFRYFKRRDGAEMDVENMEKLLKELGYKVEVKWNLTSQDMAETLKQFAARDEHQTSDSTFLVLMSHGVKAGLCGTDSKDESTDLLLNDSIFSAFNNKNCKALMRKPKVIIIQACRGKNEGRVFVSDSAGSPSDDTSITVLSPEEYEDDSVEQVHLESDFIGFYSTTPDTMAWREKKTGSIFITRLTEYLRKHAWNCPLEEIFRKVQNSFDDFPRQMPTKERTTFKKKFYLFPGH